MPEPSSSDSLGETDETIDLGAHDQEALFEAAQSAIESKRPDRLRTLLEACPELARAKNEKGQDLLSQTLSYANFVGDQAGLWTSTPCAEVLVQFGAVPTADVCNRAAYTGDTEMVRMFLGHEVIPANLRNTAAAGDLARVRNLFTADGELRQQARPSEQLHERHVEVPDPQDDDLVIADAFRLACRCGHIGVAGWLLERALELDAGLAEYIESWSGPEAVLDFLMENRVHVDVLHSLSIRESVQLSRLQLAVGARDVESFLEVLEAEPRFLGEECVSLQNQLIEGCAYGQGADLTRALLDLQPAIQANPPRDSRALVYAIDYGDREMIELLLPFWEPRDDLPTWAGLGRLDRARSFFDADGRLKPHPAEVYPEDADPRDTDSILVHALGLACMNQQLDVADFLLRRGADLDGPWGQHEPATILHEVAANGRLESVRFLLRRGSDVTIRDARFGATALDWARYVGQEEAQGLLQGPTVAADFFSAVQYGSLDVIREHVEKGQDVNASLDFTQTQGVTALFLAVFQDRPEVVEYLLRQGAEAAAGDSRDRGVFHRLQQGCAYGERIARALIEHGADVDRPDETGVTPRDHAEELGLKEVVALFDAYQSS